MHRGGDPDEVAMVRGCERPSRMTLDVLKSLKESVANKAH